MAKILEFPMMELKYAWKEASQRLRQNGIAQPLLDSRLLLQHVLGFTYEDILKNATRKLTQKEIEEYAKLLARRMHREPVSVILGIKPFWKHQFLTTKDTLDPRPDSEALIDAVLRRYPDRTAQLRVLDLGTGTGALLLSVLDEYANATGLGVDISEKALDVARRNALNLGLDSRAVFKESDWLSGVEGKFDIVLANLPYIPTGDIETLEPEVRDYDPHLALDGGTDGLDAYRLVAAALKPHVHENSLILFEIGAGQEDQVSAILADRSFEVIAKEPDLTGKIRCLVVRVA